MLPNLVQLFYTLISMTIITTDILSKYNTPVLELELQTGQICYPNIRTAIPYRFTSFNDYPHILLSLSLPLSPSIFPALFHSQSVCPLPFPPLSSFTCLDRYRTTISSISPGNITAQTVLTIPGNITTETV